ncbi:hypothetical protein FBG13_04220 [Cobetia marina]|uniref:DUF6489 family protein n=1 Tax=Cobetia marina TaxID=28258 RepID=UPI0010ADE210|nr:DUF6489 family protein [Cobetia marina]TKD64450.1 hypothetical protein FBG13_04220 [Cobetia marina]
MKINVEFDLTPQEFRQAMGLPDVEAFQQELMERFRRQMEAGVEGYDPMSLLKPLMTPGAGTPFTRFMPPGMAEGMAGMGGASAADSPGASSNEMGDSMAKGMAAFQQYQKMMLDTLQQFGQQGAGNASGGASGGDSEPAGNDPHAGAAQKATAEDRPKAASARSRSQRD